MKNNRIVYYIVQFIYRLVPSFLLRLQAQYLLNKETAKDIAERVNYYNKLNVNTRPDQKSLTIKDISFGSPSSYYIDLKALLRYFNPKLTINFLFGDITHVPDFPCIVKSRPISENNQNSILLKLNKVRHFNFIKDNTDYDQKMDKIVWRGNILDNQVTRQKLFEKHYNKDSYDIGHVNDYDNNKWKTERLSIKEQLKYKIILSIEGNDVATNLKWVLSSNSLCVMPKPYYETWFMEGKLKAGVHYVEVKEDFSDLDEKVDYYFKHPKEAKKIISNANAYTQQFKNTKQEKLISLLVLDKYFKSTMQTSNTQ